MVLEHDNTVIFLHTAEQFRETDQRPLTFTSISLMENILVIENYLHRVMLHRFDLHRCITDSLCDQIGTIRVIDAQVNKGSAVS